MYVCIYIYIYLPKANRKKSTPTSTLHQMPWGVSRIPFFKGPTATRPATPGGVVQEAQQGGDLDGGDGAQAMHAELDEGNRQEAEGNDEACGANVGGNHPAVFKMSC